MPPRKSDQRKSDASAARFSLKDPVDEPAQPSPVPTAAVPHLDSQDSADKTSSTQAHDKKDKEKDKEKEKEKEKEKDAVSIDVRSRIASQPLPSISSYGTLTTSHLRTSHCPSPLSQGWPRVFYQPTPRFKPTPS
jgi:hypothetical protein